MAAFIPSMRADESPGKTAGRIRTDFADHLLKGYKIPRVKFVAAAVAEAYAELDFGDAVLPAKLRWIRESEDGSPAAPDVAGEWQLYKTGPWAMLAPRSDEDADHEND